LPKYTRLACVLRYRDIIIRKCCDIACPICVKDRIKDRTLIRHHNTDLNFQCPLDIGRGQKTGIFADLNQSRKHLSTYVAL
jgi:hypothetical protein